MLVCIVGIAEVPPLVAAYVLHSMAPWDPARPTPISVVAALTVWAALAAATTWGISSVIYRQSINCGSWAYTYR